MLDYNPAEFKTPGTGFFQEGLWLRLGVIQSIDINTGLVTIRWSDYPGVRTDVPISQSAYGTFDIPPVGSLVIVGFDQGFKAHILRYLPVGFSKQIIDGDIRAIKAGEKLFMSYTDNFQKTSKDFPVPKATGTLIHMNTTGDIELSTAFGDRWFMNNLQNTIEQNSMNYMVQTEAGLLEFGLIKRKTSPKDVTPTLIGPNTVTNSLVGPPNLSSGVFTEFRLRVLEKADADFSTVPEVDNPFIELNLGVKVDNDGNKVKTTTDHFEANNDIVIQLKTKSGQGFEFTVDKGGNLTLKTGANIKIGASKDMNIEIGGDTNITSAGDVSINAAKVKLIGDKAIVLEDFISKFNQHTHKGVMPGGSTTLPPTPISKSSVVSKKVKVL